jgi:hypothetical protein
MSSAITAADAAAAASLGEKPEEPAGEELNTPMEVDPTVGASPPTEPAAADTSVAEKQAATQIAAAAQPAVADPPASDDDLDSDDVSSVPSSAHRSPNGYCDTT